jgi:hypothetical protein
MQGVFLVRSTSIPLLRNNHGFRSDSILCYPSDWFLPLALLFTLLQHVLADTLGSVGVIGSTLLVNHTGWTGWDPIASLFIAALIIASVIPLVIDAGKILCLDVGESREKDVRLALSEVCVPGFPLCVRERRIWSLFPFTSPFHLSLATSFLPPQLSTIEGLASYASPRFWPNDESTITGSIHIQLARLPSSDPGRPADGVSQGYAHPVQHANLEKVVNRVNALLKKRIRGLKELTVQVETEEQGMGRRGWSHRVRSKMSALRFREVISLRPQARDHGSSPTFPACQGE